MHSHKSYQFPVQTMNETHIAAAAEEVNCTRQELAKAREELSSFKSDPQSPSYFEGNAQGYFIFLIEQVKERESALKERELALIELYKLDIQKSKNSKPSGFSGVGKYEQVGYSRSSSSPTGPTYTPSIPSYSPTSPSYSFT